MIWSRSDNRLVLKLGAAWLSALQQQLLQIRLLEAVRSRHANYHVFGRQWTSKAKHHAEYGTEAEA